MSLCMQELRKSSDKVVNAKREAWIDAMKLAREAAPADRCRLDSRVGLVLRLCMHCQIGASACMHCQVSALATKLMPI